MYYNILLDKNLKSKTTEYQCAFVHHFVSSLRRRLKCKSIWRKRPMMRQMMEEATDDETDDGGANGSEKRLSYTQ
jgi:hypothetical protein